MSIRNFAPEFIYILSLISFILAFNWRFLIPPTLCFAPGFGSIRNDSLIMGRGKQRRFAMQTVSASLCCPMLPSKVLSFRAPARNLPVYY